MGALIHFLPKKPPPLGSFPPSTGIVFKSARARTGQGNKRERGGRTGENEGSLKKGESSPVGRSVARRTMSFLSRAFFFSWDETGFGGRVRRMSGGRN